jgi:hypothetical protein
MNRELLERVPEVLRRGQRDEMIDLAARIDAALSAPEPGAMEIVDEEAVEQLAAECLPATADHCDIDRAAGKIMQFIESHSKRVPRAMLEELIEKTISCHELARMTCHDGEEIRDDEIDAIAAKYGYRAE